VSKQMKISSRPIPGREFRMRRYHAVICLALLSLSALSSSCTQTASPSAPIEYHNTEYGFSFALPADWQGYSIIVGNWTGDVSDSSKGDVPALQGPLISIRHPLWTAQNPRQDIPILIFTHPQWDALQRGEFLVSAAGVGPTELGQNANYAFALPPRYDYALLPGYEEVEKIMEGNPLHTP